jgi:hypothetical protein
LALGNSKNAKIGKTALACRMPKAMGTKRTQNQQIASDKRLKHIYFGVFKYTQRTAHKSNTP